MGLYFVAHVKIQKRINQRGKSYNFYNLRLLHELRDTKFSYLSKDKKDKNFHDSLY